MGFYEWSLIFNVLSQPLVPSELPSRVTHYYLGHQPDTLLENITTYKYLNDSLIEIVSDAFDISTRAETKSTTYWGLNRNNQLDFISAGKTKTPIITESIFQYNGNTLVRILGYTNGLISDSVNYSYQNGILIQTTLYNKAVLRHTFTYSYTNGLPSRMNEDYGTLKYRDTVIYSNGKAVEKDRTVTAGSSSNSIGKYSYANNRLIKFEDYDVTELIGLDLFEYGVTAIISTNGTFKKTGGGIWKQKEVDGLGRVHQDGNRKLNLPIRR